MLNRAPGFIPETPPKETKPKKKTEAKKPSYGYSFMSPKNQGEVDPIAIENRAAATMPLEKYEKMVRKRESSPANKEVQKPVEEAGADLGVAADMTASDQEQLAKLIGKPQTPPDSLTKNIEDYTLRVKGMREGLELRRKALTKEEVPSLFKQYTDRDLGKISDAVVGEHRRREAELDGRAQSIPGAKNPLEELAGSLDDETLDTVARDLTEEVHERLEKRDAAQKGLTTQVDEDLATAEKESGDEELESLLKKLSAREKVKSAAQNERMAVELEEGVRKAAMENLDYEISTARLTRAVKHIGIEKGKIIDKHTPEQHKGFMRSIEKRYRAASNWQKALFAGVLLSGIAVTTLHNLKDVQKPSITIAGEIPKPGGFNFEYFYPHSTPGAPAFKYAPGMGATERLFDSPIQVTEQDRLRGLWGILEKKLTGAKIIDASTSAQKKNYMIDFLEKKLQTLGPEGVKEIGFGSGDINVIHAGEKLNLSILDSAGWIKHLRVFR